MAEIRTTDQIKTDKSENPAIKFREVGVQQGLWKSGYRFIHYCNDQLFRGVDFKGKSMLDIGCGDGLFMIWAAVNGASPAIGLEPLADGSGYSRKVKHILYQMTETLKLDNVERLPYTLQDYECPDATYDIILMHAAINHIDEEKCVELRRSVEAREIYMDVFRKLRRMMRKNGKLIIVDASNRNFYGDLGFFKKNPVNPKLRWHNHQTPQFWSEMLIKAGFSGPQISWLSNAQLGPLGAVLRNKVLAYFLESAFRLELTAS